MSIQTASILFRICCWATILTGLASLSGSHPFSQSYWLGFVNFISGSQEQSLSFARESFVLNGILGGLMIGWGTMMLLLTSAATHNFNVWKAILIGLLFWFVFDSTGSYLSGFHLNILLNILFLLPFLLSLFFLKPTIRELS